MSSPLDEAQRTGKCVLDLDVPAVDQIMLELGIVALWRLRRVNREAKRRVEQELLSLPKAVLRVGGWVDSKVESFESSQTVVIDSNGVHVFSFATMFWEARRELSERAVHHTVCDTSDGRVVVCGGPGPRNAQQLLCGAPSWSYLPDIRAMCKGASSVELSDKRIMVAGGTGGRRVSRGSSYGLADKKVFILKADQSEWEQAEPMNTARISPAIAALADGRVLVAGGRRNMTTTVGVSLSSFDTAEIWDPATGCWTTVESMTVRRANPAACMLSDGRVMVMGGSRESPHCEIFDPATNLWQMGAPLPAKSDGIYKDIYEKGHTVFKHTSIRAVAVRGGVLAADSSRDPFLYDETLGKWIRIPTSGGL